MNRITCLICQESTRELLAVTSRGGRYLGILVILQYRNQTIRVLSKFQKNDIIAVFPCLETFFGARRSVIAILLQTKVWYLINKKD